MVHGPSNHSTVESQAALPEARPVDGDGAAFDDNGVDLTLVRLYLKLSPLQRLHSLQNMVRALDKFRPGGE